MPDKQSKINTPSTSPKLSLKKPLLIVMLSILLISTIVLAAFNAYNPKRRPGTTTVAQPIPQKSIVPVTKNSVVAHCKDLTATIVEGEFYCRFNHGDINRQTLQIQHPDGSTDDLFTTTNFAELHNEPDPDVCPLGGEDIEDVSFSPNCKYITFEVTSWEWSDQYIMNRETNKTIYKTNNEFGYLGDMIWSPDNERYVIVETPNMRGGWGQNALYASNPENQDEFSRVWEMDRENDFEGIFSTYGEIVNVHFISNESVYFTPFADRSLYNEELFPGVSIKNIPEEVNIQLKYNFSTNKVEKVYN